MKKAKTVDEYIQQIDKKWKPLIEKIREILLTTKLDETVKWSFPVYTLGGKNVIGLGTFKSYVSIWFFQGVFLKDEHRKLVNAQQGVTKGLRQWRFSDEHEINEKLIRAYVEEAIANQEKGLVVQPKKKKMIEIPDLFKQVLNSDPSLKNTFNSLSEAKKREYAEYIAEAKREETRKNRLEKIIPLIKSKRGLNDRYR